MQQVRSGFEAVVNFRSTLCLAGGVLILLGIVGALAWGEDAPEAALPVREGLVFHVAPSAEAIADGALPADEMRLAAINDRASARGLATQSVRDAQPLFRIADTEAWLEFDGEDDHLVAAGPDEPLDAATIFILARPNSNAGGFRGLLSASDTAGNDYTTGVNIDLGPEATEQLSVLNVEGAGTSGAADLFEGTLPFGGFHVITLRVDDDEATLRLDGEGAGRRSRDGGSFSLRQILLGARHYDNSGGTPFASGFLDGDLGEVIIYGRLLSEDEQADVEDYLLGRRDDLHQAAAALEDGHLLEVVDDAPPVQMLVPGFEVHELPVELTNINNVIYRPDGKLFALAYNGNVWLLSDTDGDGLEDEAELFWENDGSIVAPIGMTLTPPDYEHGDGVFFASKHEIALVVDTDGDDRADEKITVADGWEPTFHQVDALGVALDDDNAVYFGLGTANFADPYLIDSETDEAAFDIEGERGTIQKVSPDFSSRETLATGVRFSVGLAFNHRGDLFATDQEGATWLHHGNPFDELLHITPDRHFGFPPRHPDYLPDVIDEPSTFDYGPQHQATSGLHFNEPAVAGATIFGPDWWAHDAIVAGESRGKIYRTKLVKTDLGYVAHNETIARLGMLTIDAAPTPEGGLVVACHSGEPDWGTGPSGEGTLYKIVPAEREAPQPVIAWAAGPREVRVAFDRPLESAALEGLVDEARIEYGRAVDAGDRFETLQPPYAVVRNQRSMRRYDLPIHAVQVSQDGRTLIIETDPHAAATHYALTLPGMGRPDADDLEGLPQRPAIDLHYTLDGVEATWADAQGNVRWTGWLPHFDLDVSRELTQYSVEHQQLWELIEEPGSLTLRTRLDIEDMLRPAVQLGSERGFEYEREEEVSLSFNASTEVDVEQRDLDEAPQFREVQATLATGPETRFTVAFHTNEDDRKRPLPLRRFKLPWSSTTETADEAFADAVPPELEGGNWAAGRELYFGDRALCSRCHLVGGEGGRIGPDLSNLRHRDYASVLRDIATPSATLNPDHVTYQVELEDGRVLVGVPRSVGSGRLLIGDAAGQETEVSQDDVVSMQPLDISIMPAGLNEALGEEDFRDLMTFLMTRPLEPGPIEEKTPPEPRTRGEINAILDQSDRPDGTPEPMRLLLIAGPKDHGPDEHDYPLWLERWSKLLGLAENVEVEAAEDWPDGEAIERADVLVIYRMGTWSDEQAQQVDEHLADGGGAVYIHWAVAAGEHAADKAERIGLAWGAGARFRHGPLDLSFSEHPITQGFDTLDLVDESYWQLTGEGEAIDVLSTGVEQDEPQPLMWTRQVGPGRVFVSIPGHYSWTFDDPLFRVLLLRGIAWAGQQPTNRLIDLSTIGARIKD